MWRSAVQKFSSGGSGFDPSFSKAEKVRVVGIDQIRQCSRIKRMEDRADVESAHSGGGRTWIEFNVAGQKNKQKRKRLRKRRERARVNKAAAKVVRLRWEYC